MTKHLKKTIYLKNRRKLKIRREKVTIVFLFSKKKNKDVFYSNMGRLGIVDPKSSSQPHGRREAISHNNVGVGSQQSRSV